MKNNLEKIKHLVFSFLPFIKAQPVFMIGADQQLFETLFYLLKNEKKDFLKQVFLICLKLNGNKDFFGLIKKSHKSICLVSGVEKKVKTMEFVRALRAQDVFIFNFDDQEARALREIHEGNSFSYGFLKSADLIISGLNSQPEETNFKMEFNGSLVPFWLKGKKTKEEVLVVAGAAAVCLQLGLNLVEISQKLKNL